ncbi:LamB/YcsF family protein [Salimicrobium jeotgali]|uniref:LamB/YcsF family protein n=1 Tax=Salimicrobium jeotgali TaxID=1230341 RepID=UPI000C864B4E|nr:5-oxoprolinase subunit PxpA [Salimicrobium jeotgali]
MAIDLNCDMGEGFGVYNKGRDREVLDHVTSANIACGFHAGDSRLMKETVRMAAEKNVAVGAHPGLPDLAGFGRRKMDITPEDAYDFVLYQTGALQAFAEAEGTRLQHVKPHGALYNTAAKDAELAQAIAEAVRDAGGMMLYGLAGSELLKAGKNAGLTVVSEVFADRLYQPDGTLTPRKEKGAVITDRDQALEQVRDMVLHQRVRTGEGTTIDIQADSVCVHGDNSEAVDFTRSIRKFLEDNDISMKAPGV